MIHTSTVTHQIEVEERLNPNVCKEDNANTHQHSSHSCQHNFGKVMHSKLTTSLFRSRSLEKLKRFPSYLCTKGSTEFKVWLENSRTALSESIIKSLQLVHTLCFISFVYSIILFIFAQTVFILNTLILSKSPRGPTFLYVTTAMLGVIICIVVPHMSPQKPMKVQPNVSQTIESTEAKLTETMATDN